MHKFRHICNVVMSLFRKQNRKEDKISCLSRLGILKI